MSILSDRRVRLIPAALIAVCISVTAGLAQPLLQITFPVDGAMVSSGQTLNVTVSAVEGVFQLVAVVGEDPIGDVDALASPPYQFAVTIPAGVASRKYRLSAIGTSADGSAIRSSIMIDIERPDQPVKIMNELPSSTINCVGCTFRLDVDGVFSDGARLDITHSSLTTYSSDNAAIAWVDSDGVVTAVGSGAANITITNAGVSTTVPVTVPQPVRVFPSSISLHPSETEQFDAHLAMPPGTDPTVAWSIHPDLGSIDGTGLYTAPSAVDSEKRVVITATSVADPTKSGSADVVLLPSVSVSLDPTSASLSAGGGQWFNATVTNALDQTLKWSISPKFQGAPQSIYLMAQEMGQEATSGFWLQAQELEGAGLQGRGLGELLEGGAAGFGRDAAGVAAARGEFPQQGFEAVDR